MDFKAVQHWFTGHKGPIVGFGEIEVTGKQNQPDKLILKASPIRKCKLDGELFSTPEDLMGMMG